MTLSCTAGGITGRDHVRAGRDGQDGWALLETPSVVAAIVTDGCSSGTSSELGARLGARWIAGLVARRFDPAAPVASARTITRALVAHLAVAARSLSVARRIEAALVGDTLLFGFLAAVVTDEHALVFGVGDGIVWVDGVATILDPGPENAPPYLAYALLGAAIEPVIHFAGRADAIAIATDGAAPIAGELGTLVDDAPLFRNRSLLRKRLAVRASELWDDTTIAIVRRERP